MELTASSAQSQTGSDPESLIRRHQAGVWRYLRVLGCSGTEADDLTQETFLVLLRTGFVERRPGATWSYLRKTARNLFLGRCRAKRRAREEQRAELVDELWAAQPDTSGDAWLEALRSCLETLNGRSKRAVQLFYVHEHSRTATAAALNMKAAGVKTLLQRTRAHLRECIHGRMR